MPKDERRLRIGVLGCGPIAQAAHFESCAKARNAELHAICDVAPDLVERMRCIHVPTRAFTDYDTMLADPELEAVIVATADAHHVTVARRALEAGKHVLCEKPLATSVEDAEALAAAVAQSGRVLQVAHMRRFDPGIEAAHDFIAREMGGVIGYKGWYCDSTHRYTMTDALQPLMVRSPQSLRPSGDPKADRQRYLMLAHGSHLFDLARHLAGEITAVRARHSDRFGVHCWFIETEFASGCLGQLDLTIPVRMGWHEGVQIYGQYGSVVATIHSPWYFRASDVELFSERDTTFRRPLGADGHHYRRQVEGFASVILDGAPMRGADISDGLASVRAMAAVGLSARENRSVRLADIQGVI